MKTMAVQTIDSCGTNNVNTISVSSVDIGTYVAISVGGHVVSILIPEALGFSGNVCNLGGS